MKKEIEEIWEDLNGELFKFIYGRVNNEHIAKDILQEVFLKIQLNINQLKNTSKLTSWVYQITRNAIFDHFRKSKKEHTLIDNLDFPENESSNIPYGKLSDCINSKIEALQEKHKQAIVLTSFKEYSQKDLAAQLQISYSGTKSRIQKAREILKEELLNCPRVEADAAGKLIDYDEKDS
ncbi:RNA polymerase sigma factor SigZ [Maribacter sp.]|nr:RNA polymerase sigma factor SigZ [Maribacter sp.]